MTTLACIGLGLAVPAQSQPNAAGKQDSIVVTGQQHDNKVVCRFEQNTGSRFPSRTCHTNKEWDDIREQQIRTAHEMIDKPFLPDCRNAAGGC